MIGLGTIINCGSVLAGASVGMLLKNGLSKRFEDTIMQGIGLCTMFIGIGGALSGLLTLENGQLATQHTMLLILSLALGALIGEALNIEKHLEDFGVFCQNRLKSSGDSHFVEGFVSFSLLICIGAMAIVGSLQDGLSGDASLLIAKAIIDGIAAVVFAASLGKGVFLSILPLGVYQGAITLLAGFLAPVMTPAATAELSAVGSILLVGLGLNLAGAAKVRVMNMVPSIFIAIALAQVIH